MTYTPPDRQLIWDIVERGRIVARYAQGATRETLDTDDMRASAIIWQIAIVGEAASKLSTEFRDQHPEVQWRAIIATRNILIHAYRDVDLDKVWTVVSQGLPELLAVLEPLNREPPDESAD